MANFSFTFRRKRAEEVLFPILDAYRHKAYLYRVYHHQQAPQNKSIPKDVMRGSREHVVWLFYVALMNVRSRSKYIFKRAVLLHKKYPELFREEVLSLDPVDIANRLRDVGGFAYPRQWAVRWRKCSDTLFGMYHGDPIAIFSDAPTVNAFLDMKRSHKNQWLCGYGPKIYSLFSLFCEELGLIDHIVEAIPVDEHLQRICITTGILECYQLDGVNKRRRVDIVDAASIAEFLRRKLTKFCYKHGINVGELAHALWFLGSEACYICHMLDTLELVCPVCDLCSGPLETKRYTNERIWEVSNRKRKGSTRAQRTFSDPSFMYFGTNSKPKNTKSTPEGFADLGMLQVLLPFENDD
jgi:endonuclease III